MPRKGRPTGYRKEYCKQVVDYFNVPHTKMKEITKITNGQVVKASIEVPNEWPNLYGFAAEIGVGRRTLNEWCDKHPDFLRAVNEAKAYAADMIIKNGLMGRYNNRIVPIMLANMFGIRENESSTQDSNVTVIVDGSRS